jgi:hypothetical protein
MPDFNKILGPVDRNKLAILIGKLKSQHPGYGRGRDTNNQDKGAIFILDTISGELLSGNLDLREES